MFIFDISFNIGIYKCVPPASCSATLYPELPVIVWFTLNRIFTHSSSKPNVWKCQLSLPCPRYNSSFQMYLPRAAFLKSLVFSVGVRCFKVWGVVYSYQTIYRDAKEQLPWLLSILAISSLGNHLNS